MNKPVDIKITDMKERYSVWRSQSIVKWDIGSRTTSRRTPTSSPCSASRRRRASTRSKRPPPLRVRARPATWTVVWTDRLTDSEYYRAKAYKVDEGAGHARPVLRLHRL